MDIYVRRHGVRAAVDDGPRHRALCSGPIRCSRAGLRGFGNCQRVKLGFALVQHATQHRLHVRVRDAYCNSRWNSGIIRLFGASL